MAGGGSRFPSFLGEGGGRSAVGRMRTDQALLSSMRCPTASPAWRRAVRGDGVP
jgi:hypothetical protein